MKSFCWIASCLVSCVAVSAQVVAPTVQVGSVAMGGSRATVVQVTLPYAATLGSIGVFAGGWQNMDFTAGSGSSCKAGVAYAAGATCTLQVMFAPKSTGVRYGEYMLYATNGQVLASGYLVGTGAGPRTSFLPATASAPLLPYGVVIKSAAVDENNGFYVAEPEVAFSPGATSPGAVYPLNASFVNPDHVEVDGGGNVYVDDSFGAAPGKYVPETAGTFGVQNILPVNTGRAVDGVGNLFSLCGTAVCEEVRQANAGYVPTTLVGGFVAPGTVAVDVAGNLYVTDFTPTPVVYKETLANGIYVQSTIGKGWKQPSALNVDAAGNVYVYDAPFVYRETPLTGGGYRGIPVYVDSKTTQFLTVSPQGNVYAAQSGFAGEYGLEDALIELNTEVTPTLTFSKTAKGTVSKDGVRPVLVTNSGSAPLHFSGVTFPADFPERANEIGDCRASTVLVAGQSCSLSITFAPGKVLGGTSAVLTEQVVIATDTLGVAGTIQKITVSGTELPATTAAVVR